MQLRMATLSELGGWDTDKPPEFIILMVIRGKKYNFAQIKKINAVILSNQRLCYKLHPSIHDTPSFYRMDWKRLERNGKQMSVYFLGSISFWVTFCNHRTGQ